MLFAAPFANADCNPSKFHIHPNGGGKVSDCAEVDPSAFVDQYSTIGAGVAIETNTRITDSKISDGSEVESNATVNDATITSSEVGDFAKINDSILRNATEVESGAVVNDATLREQDGWVGQRMGMPSSSSPFGLLQSC